ncbi:MAG: hypothetical protein JWQ34_2601 [Mucilaginibacter sp.]|uniref:hypothetical protein n=1 Tax=Mucilaginibacter sp. TaxID=1882438 RepID=UPI002615FD45|nr:hypothetical protein [Mucilaginibacter sp.]MDB5004376.1 hypothetical protein [Mucilaginibacter sp.]
MNFNREELYELIWTKPLSSVAATCGVSMPVLRQLCLDHAIPLPWGGFKPGKERTELPESQGFDFPAALAAAANSLHFPGETTATFQVARKLNDPDPYIIAAQNTIKEDYQFHRMPHMLRAGFGQLAIRSSKSNWDRALRIMDTLVKAWQHRGYRISNQDKETIVHLREVRIKVSLRETTTVTPPKEKYGSQIHTATGQLALKIDGWLDREWKDGKVPLETHIQEILDHMEVAARDLEKVWAKRQAEEEQEAIEEQAEATRLKENTEEAAAFEALLQEAQRWHQFTILDQYLDALQKSIPRSPAFQQWLNWARHRRRLFDPIAKAQQDNKRD